MHKTISTSRGKLHLDTGTEGPSWDPYGYTEITLVNPHYSCTIHSGLAEYLELDSIKDSIHIRIESYDGSLDMIFEQITGYSAQVWESWIWKVRSKCRKCGSYELRSSYGYPGEHLLLCNKCDSVIDYSFCESEII